MFRKVLIANRGEIALRIIRSCRELGISTVAVFSEADRNALHVRFADEAVCIGPAPAVSSYLHQPSVLAAAEITEADAVHPGYGFLAENAEFASAVRAMGKAFVGPSVDHLRMFGDKLQAKDAARLAGMPLLEGSPGAVDTVDAALKAAEVAGYPVMVKAAGGGGGKGMRVVRDKATLERAFDLCRTEAQAAFGVSEVFVERFLDAPRHVEVQVVGDGQGNALHLGTRDCSMQRRHQKLLEEAPAPNLPPELRASLESAAAKLIATVGYCGLATVELLVQDGAFYFLEVNPRIQVEHPVTEEVTGVDLVALQLRVCAGQGFGMSQADVRFHGHAIEVRVNAEDPFTFVPCPGRISGYHAPGGPGVRVDSAAHEDALVPPYYDSMVAKLIVWAPTRQAALARLRGALDEMVVEGISTTIPLHEALLRTPELIEVRHTTGFVDAWLAAKRAE